LPVGKREGKFFNMAPFKVSGSYKDILNLNLEIPVNDETILPTKFWWLVTAALVAVSAFVGYKLGSRERRD
jgi:hypothetical protein